MEKLLEGIRIIDFSMFVAGPFATSILGELGAEILKVEPIDGDPVRNNGVGPRDGDESVQFQAYNHGKKSISIDLKKPFGKKIILDLVKNSHVVFDNFRPGVMERLGLGHETISKMNQKIISVSLSGFGSNGPWSKRPGYDLIVQALGGALSLSGNKNELPVHIPFHIGDTAAGLYAAITMLSAVLNAERTGIGKCFEVSMLESQLHLLSDEITFFSTGKWASEPHGSGHPALAPYAVFPTKDHPIVIAAVGTEKFWINLINILNSTEFFDNKKFVNNESRVENMDEMKGIIEEKLLTKTAAFWIKAFQKNDVPAARVLTVGDAINSEQVRFRKSVDKIGSKKILAPRLPIREYGQTLEHHLEEAPLLNRDLDFILSNILSYDDKEIESIKEEISN